MVAGKPLIEQPVIRAKFAAMLAKIELGQSWLETITYQSQSLIIITFHFSFSLANLSLANLSLANPASFISVQHDVC